MSSITVEGHPHGLYGGTPVVGTFASTGAVPQAVIDLIADANWCVRVGSATHAYKGGEWVEVITAGIGPTGATGPASTVAGKSAYQEAVEGGYVGDVTQWLDSLQGEDSVVPGERGMAGDSAYLSYQNGGGTLSEADWIASLEGADGDSAYDIALADDGSVGTEAEWLASLVGSDGDSAYVASGSSLTETEWLASLKGKDAHQLYLDNGGTDDAGTWLTNMQGQDGIGQSAYESAVQEGYTGTKPEWLETLKGNTAYQIWVNAGNSGTEADYIEFTRGKSAFELWELNNPGKTLDEYLATLKGADGGGFKIHDPYSNYLEHETCYKDGKFYVANTVIAGTVAERPFVEGDGYKE